MLHEEDDPLSSSMFATANANSILGNTMTTSMFSSAYEEDPWGSHTTPMLADSTTADMNRSFTTPNFNTYTTTSDANRPTSSLRQQQQQQQDNILNASTVLSKKITICLGYVYTYIK